MLSIPFEITIALICLILIVILSFLFKNYKKQDNGFVLNYYKLSYRRKMIRTLWMLPLVAITLIAIYLFTDLNTIEKFVILMDILIVLLIQFGYNFIKWKKTEKIK